MMGASNKRQISQYVAHFREADGVPQSLEEHLFSVAQVARSHAGKLRLAGHGELLGLLHDLGKYSNQFQAYLKSAVGLLNQDEDEEFVEFAGIQGKIDHSTAGAQLVWRELSKKGQLGEVAGQILALCIASHHSGVIDCLTSELSSFGEDRFSRRMAKTDERTHLDEVLSKADPSVIARAQEIISDPETLGGVRTAVRAIIDKDPSRNLDGILVRQKIGLLVRFLFSCLIDADRSDTADFERPHAARQRLRGHYADWGVLIQRLERYLQNLKPRHAIDSLRQDISRHCLERARDCKGLYTLTVPTGGGKTLSSLRFALHHAHEHALDRVIYVIPFTSIIDQNADVARDILEPAGDPESHGRVVLEHHSNLTPDEQGWREKILTENWDAPVIYTTMVQFLETLFGSGTRSARRMHQLANAVLIFDEIQTLPIRCVHLFNNAINFLVEQCGSTVVLCTATQPLLDQVDRMKGAIRAVPRNELMPDVKQLFDSLKRVEVVNSRKAGGWTNEEIAKLAIAETRRTNGCLIIVNTKESAQALFGLCSGEGRAAYHLSTNMCPAHRKAVLAQVKEDLRDSRPVLCVSTQLIEAGVDIDFGSVIRFAAGLDSIAQAAGRCNRNGRPEPGLVHVVNPRDENLDRLADIRVGRDKAERVLADYDEKPEIFNNNRIGPEAIGWYYQNYFFARKGEMEYPAAAREIGHDDSLLNLLSTNAAASMEYRRHHGQMPNLFLRQSFMAAAKAFKAIDAPTRGVIVPYGENGRKLIDDLCAASDVEKQYSLLRTAQQYTVNVFPWVLERLQKEGAVHPIQPSVQILYLDERYYRNEDFGLDLEGTAQMRIYNG